MVIISLIMIAQLLQHVVQYKKESEFSKIYDNQSIAENSRSLLLVYCH